MNCSPVGLRTWGRPATSQLPNRAPETRAVERALDRKTDRTFIRAVVQDIERAIPRTVPARALSYFSKPLSIIRGFRCDRLQPDRLVRHYRLFPANGSPQGGSFNQENGRWPSRTCRAAHPSVSTSRRVSQLDHPRTRSV